MSRLKFLLTNDDGIDGEGLKVLAEKLSAVADVYIVAPAEDSSGVSGSITMFRSLEVRRTGKNAYSCSGTPVDCVVLATQSDLFSGMKFDAIFSGINAGANMGTDVIYSGTAGAARQGALHDIPSFALSIDSDGHDYEFSALASYIAGNIDEVLGLWKKGAFVNINAFSAESYDGIEFASLCNRDYHDKVILEQAGDGWMTHFVGGTLDTEGGDDSDYAVTRRGKIAVSLIAAQPELLG